MVESSDTRMFFDQGALRPCEEYWKIIQAVNGQIEPTRDIAYERFLEEVESVSVGKAHHKIVRRGLQCSSCGTH